MSSELSRKIALSKDRAPMYYIVSINTRKALIEGSYLRGHRDEGSLL